MREQKLSAAAGAPLFVFGRTGAQTTTNHISEGRILFGAELPKLTQDELVAKFQGEFGSVPQVFSAPGRINLIGEHTDYNEGFVLPCAIGFYIHACVSPRSDQRLLLKSTAFEQNFEFDLDHLPARKLSAWCDYVLGVVFQLKAAGVTVKGVNLLVHGEVPLGAGLSSSAALEVASALALLNVASAELPFEAIPKLCRRAENEFVGAHVGIMDQFVSCFGREGHAILLDCRSLDYQLVPIPQTVRFVICNTKVKHELSSSEYNRRRAECEEAVRVISETYPGIRSLRDVSIEQLSALSPTLPSVLFKRAHHVVAENARVLRAVESFGAADLGEIRTLMRESHRSLRDDYQVSCRELDLMVEAADGLPGYYGGRMTGGGFGGCTVNVVEAIHAREFAEQIAERYREQTRISPDVYICSAAEGAAAELRRHIL